MKRWNFRKDCCNVRMWHLHEDVLLLEANRQRMSGKDAQNALPGRSLGKKVLPYFGVCFPLDLKFH